MVIDLITVGQKDQFFTIIRAMVFRGNDPVGDNIIDEIGSSGARVTEIMDLNRCRAAGQYAQTSAFGVPFKLN